VVRTPEPHHLEGEYLLAVVVSRAEPDRQVDLPEGLYALARRDAMERRRARPQLIQPDPPQTQRVRVEMLRLLPPSIRTFENRAFPMTGSTTSGY
jgi:hypothetical protein